MRWKKWLSPKPPEGELCPKAFSYPKNSRAVTPLQGVWGIAILADNKHKGIPPPG